MKEKKRISFFSDIKKPEKIFGFQAKIVFGAAILRKGQNHLHVAFSEQSDEFGTGYILDFSEFSKGIAVYVVIKHEITALIKNQISRVQW